MPQACQPFALGAPRASLMSKESLFQSLWDKDLSPFSLGAKALKGSRTQVFSSKLLFPFIYALFY